VRVNPHVYPVSSFRLREWQVPRSILDHARQSLGIGGVCAVIPFDGAGDDLVYMRTLLAIAAGSAGVVYRMPEKTSLEEVKRLQAVLEDRLLVLRGSLPVWDAAECIGAVKSSDPSVGGWLMQMGPRRLAIILVDSTTKPKERRVEVPVNLPEGLRPQRVLDVDGEPIQTFTGEEKAFDFTLTAFKDGAVIFIELAKPSGIKDEF
jgi:hypothetical protein